MGDTQIGRAAPGRGRRKSMSSALIQWKKRFFWASVNGRTGRSVLRQLVEKTGEIVPKRGQWRVFYLGFNRDGWTEAAQTYVKETSTSEQQDRNWQTVGMRLLDLNQVDTDLRDWVR